MIEPPDAFDPPLSRDPAPPSTRLSFKLTGLTLQDLELRDTHFFNNLPPSAVVKVDAQREDPDDHQRYVLLTVLLFYEQSKQLKGVIKRWVLQEDAVRIMTKHYDRNNKHSNSANATAPVPIDEGQEEDEDEFLFGAPLPFT